jgi:hypothetical protein
MLVERAEMMSDEQGLAIRHPSQTSQAEGVSLGSSFQVIMDSIHRGQEQQKEIEQAILPIQQGMAMVANLTAQTSNHLCELEQKQDQSLVGCLMANQYFHTCFQRMDNNLSQLEHGLGIQVEPRYKFQPQSIQSCLPALFGQLNQQQIIHQNILNMNINVARKVEDPRRSDMFINAPVNVSNSRRSHMSINAPVNTEENTVSSMSSMSSNIVNGAIKIPINPLNNQGNIVNEAINIPVNSRMENTLNKNSNPIHGQAVESQVSCSKSSLKKKEIKKKKNDEKVALVCNLRSGTNIYKGWHAILETLFAIFFCDLGNNTANGWVFYFPFQLTSNSWCIAVSTGAILHWFPILAKYCKSRQKQKPTIGVKAVCSFLHELAARQPVDMEDRKDIRAKCKQVFPFWVDSKRTIKKQQDDTYQNVYMLNPDVLFKLFSQHPDAVFEGNEDALRIKGTKGVKRLRPRATKKDTYLPIVTLNQNVKPEFFTGKHFAWSSLHNHKLWKLMTKHAKLSAEDIIKKWEFCCQWEWKWKEVASQHGKQPATVATKKKRKIQILNLDSEEVQRLTKNNKRRVRKRL